MNAKAMWRTRVARSVLPNAACVMDMMEAGQTEGVVREEAVRHGRRAGRRGACWVPAWGRVQVL